MRVAHTMHIEKQVGLGSHGHGCHIGTFKTLSASEVSYHHLTANSDHNIFTLSRVRCLAVQVINIHLEVSSFSDVLKKRLFHHYCATELISPGMVSSLSVTAGKLNLLNL